MTHSLKGITLPATLTRICSSSFSESGLEKITIPGSCKTIEIAAFSGCKMSEVVIEEGVESIETYAFSLTELKHLILPESLKNLGEGILNQNTHIQTVYIPASIEVFRCPVSKRNAALTHIYFGGNSEKWAKYIEEAYSYAQNPEYAKSEGLYDFDCVYFYSEEKPEAPGNYWHYVDGKITVWTY